MGFTVGLVFGFAIGVVLVAGFAFLMQRRSKARIAKAADVKLLSGLAQEDIKRLCAGNSPLWISFPQFERVRWLNTQLQKVWPSVSKAAQGVIKESVEPLLESYRPVGISALKFNKLFLGYVAPQIEGVRMQSMKEGQVTMDLDFRWGGDPNIILGVHTLVGAVLPIQLKDFKFFATVRLIFQLSEQMPCISAVVVALLAKPKPEIKYTFKVIGGALTAVPGLSDMIRNLVEDIITDTLEWPHRIVVPISAEPMDLSHLNLKLQGQVKCTIVRAENLKNMELIGKSDPYVKLYIRPLLKFKTSVKSSDLNPRWNEEFTLNVEDHETQVIHFEVFDHDVGSDKTLGVVTFPVSKLVHKQQQEVPLALLPNLDTDRVKDKKDRGILHVKLTYTTFSPEECEAAMQAEKDYLIQKEKAKQQGLINSTTETVGDVVSGAGKLAMGGAELVGSGIGMVGGNLLKGGKIVSRGLSSPVGNMSKKSKDTNGASGLNGSAK